VNTRKLVLNIRLNFRCTSQEYEDAKSLTKLYGLKNVGELIRHLIKKETEAPLVQEAQNDIHPREDALLTHKIFVKTFQGHILTFTVDEYTLEEGFVKFKDPRTGEIKMFHGSNCEIKEDAP